MTDSSCVHQRGGRLKNSRSHSQKGGVKLGWTRALYKKERKAIRSPTRGLRLGNPVAPLYSGARGGKGSGGAGHLTRPHCGE